MVDGRMVASYVNGDRHDDHHSSYEYSERVSCLINECFSILSTSQLLCSSSISKRASKIGHFSGSGHPLQILRDECVK